MPTSSQNKWGALVLFSRWRELYAYSAYLENRDIMTLIIFSTLLLFPTFKSNSSSWCTKRILWGRICSLSIGHRQNPLLVLHLVAEVREAFVETMMSTNSFLSSDLFGTSFCYAIYSPLQVLIVDFWTQQKYLTCVPSKCYFSTSFQANNIGEARRGTPVSFCGILLTCRHLRRPIYPFICSFMY